MPMYFYHADALAMGGAFTRPVQKAIPSQAACSLPTIGGTASCQMDKTDFEGKISFDSVQSGVNGSFDDQNSYHVTSASVVINNLNILNVIMADQIVARLAARHAPKTPAQLKSGEATEPEIITTGCHFSGLRIAGYPVEVEMGHDLFASMPTYKHWQDAWAKKGTPRQSISSRIMGSDLDAPDSKEPEPQHLRDIRQGHKVLSNAGALQSTVLTSFVKSVKGIQGAEIKTRGPIVVIPQFGTIYLGEVIVSFGQRRVHMMRLELGSPDAGTFIFGSTGSNGSTFP